MQKIISLSELREQWKEVWGIEPHRRIGRKMMERSLAYKVREKEGCGLTPEQRKRLDKLITAYKRNPSYFDQGHSTLKPGMKLVRPWRGKLHTVTVTQAGFYYQDQEYSSLSKVASEITGSRWNGWLFFGLKNRKGSV